MRVGAILGLLGALALLGCYLGSGTPESDGRAADGPGQGLTLSGLPCPVAELLGKYCTACHGAGASSSGTSLASLDDLKKASKQDPARTEAALALARMKAGTMPPKGSPAPSATELAAFEAWVAQGLPSGSCGGVADPFAGPHVCTSNSWYGAGEGNTMEPGNACIRCHTTQGEGEGPRFSIAGTVYPTGHEPSRCNAAGVVGAEIVVVDKNGASHRFAVNSVGNFWGEGAVAMPYTARVEHRGRTRAMAAAQTVGDCNVCHTENGINGAPGRILIP